MSSASPKRAFVVELISRYLSGPVVLPQHGRGGSVFAVSESGFAGLSSALATYSNVTLDGILASRERQQTVVNEDQDGRQTGEEFICTADRKPQNRSKTVAAVWQKISTRGRRWGLRSVF